MSGVKEVMPMSGLLFQEQTLNPVLCKPKLLPLKSVTLEKLENMQKDAQQKMWELEKELVKASEAGDNDADADRNDQVPNANAAGAGADVWRADDEQQQDAGET